MAGGARGRPFPFKDTQMKIRIAALLFALAVGAASAQDKDLTKGIEHLDII